MGPFTSPFRAADAFVDLPIGSESIIVVPGPVARYLNDQLTTGFCDATGWNALTPFAEMQRASGRV